MTVSKTTPKRKNQGRSALTSSLLLGAYVLGYLTKYALYPFLFSSGIFFTFFPTSQVRCNIRSRIVPSYITYW